MQRPLLLGWWRNQAVNFVPTCRRHHNLYPQMNVRIAQPDSPCNYHIIAQTLSQRDLCSVVQQLLCFPIPIS